MKTITIFGLLYSQHISNFASTLKKYSTFKLVGINNNPTIRQGDEYYHKSKTSFDEIYEINRHSNKIVDIFNKSITPLYIMYKECKKSDVVQFHFISYFVLPLIIIVKLFSKAKISSFVYGSDFLGAGSLRRRYLELVIRYSDSVVCDSTTVSVALKDRYGKYKNKIECCFFGSVIIDKLLELSETPMQSVIKTNKKVLMCGYNGAIQQQHIEVIKSLRNVATDFHWLFPMTYAAASEYISEVRSYMETLGAEYTILDKFLSEEDWINFLRSTDVFIHMQTTDAFSAALSEQLLLGHIVINGVWLPYKDFDDNDICYFKSDFDNLEANLLMIINNCDKHDVNLKANKCKIEKIKGLKYCIINYWIPYFNRLLV